jgi:ElaB/YqjD/DUF883 family membrane-anchored ribosome-binding protein
VKTRKLYLQMEHMFYSKPVSQLTCLKDRMEEVLQSLPAEARQEEDTLKCKQAFQYLSSIKDTFVEVRKTAITSMYNQMKNIARTVVQGARVSDTVQVAGADSLVALDSSADNVEVMRETLFNIAAQFNIPQKIVGLTVQSYFNSRTPSPPALAPTLNTIMDTYIASLYPPGTSRTEDMEQATPQEQTRQTTNFINASRCPAAARVAEARGSTPSQADEARRPPSPAATTGATDDSMDTGERPKMQRRGK